MNKPSSAGREAQPQGRRLTAVRLLIAGAGILSLALGIAQGGYRDTLAKAVRICLECVGIG